MFVRFLYENGFEGMESKFISKEKFLDYIEFSNLTTRCIVKAYVWDLEKEEWILKDLEDIEFETN